MLHLASTRIDHCSQFVVCVFVFVVGLSRCGKRHSFPIDGRTVTARSDNRFVFIVDGFGLARGRVG